ncbi:MAG: aminotransferase class V-fold PLP-dependent enzyme [Paracoccaceae bacterium]
MPQLDIEFVRAQFPAFREPSLAGQAFFENAGGSYTCAQVIDRLIRYYRQRKVQPYAPYRASILAGEEMDEARARIAAMLNVGEDELHFGPSTSQNTFVLAQAFREMLAAGEAIVVTDQDHEANSGVWRKLAAAGIEIREWHVDPQTGHLDPASLAGLIDDKVRLVCFPHCSNIVGELNPVAEIAAMAHAAGAVVCVDGVSTAPHGFPDVAALGADIYMFSSYKTYGPHQGIMTITRSLADRLPNQAHYFNAGSLTRKFTPAGPDHAQIAAAAGIADYVDAVFAHHFPAAGAAPAGRAAAVLELQRRHERAMMAPLLEYLRDRNDLRLIGPASPDAKVGTISLHHRRSGEDLAAALAPKGVMAGGGDFYAVRLLESLGIDPAHGVLRASLVHYTSREEVSALIRALDEIL